MDQEQFDRYRVAETATVAPSQSLLPAMLAGLGAALIGGIGWTVLTAMTGYEVGYAAWAWGVWWESEWPAPQRVGTRWRPGRQRRWRL